MPIWMLGRPLCGQAQVRENQLRFRVFTGPVDAVEWLIQDREFWGMTVRYRMSIMVSWYWRCCHWDWCWYGMGLDIGEVGGPARYE